MPRVLLLNMPFVSLARPAIGVSILKARLAEEGIESEVGYANLTFAERVGVDAYDLIDNRLSLALFPGDWLFAQYAFGKKLDLKTYAGTLRAHAESQADYDTVIRLRHEIGPFLKDCLEHWDWATYDVVGFTTTFQQNMASIVLSGLIRKRFPNKVIVFGGGNCKGPMGMQLHKSIQWLDFVFSGESDHTFAELVKRLADGRPVTDLPGLIYRQDGDSIKAADDARVTDMDALPDPDFDDYFAALEVSPVRSKIKPALQIENARGCWWGAKAHCTFCGLNSDSIVFRAKSAERVLGEIERQVGRHGVRHFHVVDNIIPHEYFRTLLPMLQERQLGVSFFYEIKANLNREQVRLMREAGVIAVQPGVESLSTHVLRLMNKGTSAIQNIQLLKWCREYGVEVAWNLLYGFPGETAEDYREAADYMSAIQHLRAPSGAKPIRLDRFSPNFMEAESFGLTEVKPFAMYHFIYPLSAEAVTNLAYFFEYKYADGQNPDSYVGPVVKRVKEWKGNSKGDLVKRYDKNGNMVLVDTRPGRKPKGYPLKGLQCELYEFCEEIRGRKAILDLAAERFGDDEELEPAIDRFLLAMENHQLMVREGDRYLSVAVSEDCLPVLVSSN